MGREPKPCKLTVMIGLGTLLLVALLVIAGATPVQANAVHHHHHAPPHCPDHFDVDDTIKFKTLTVAPNAQLMELEPIARDPTQFYFHMTGDEFDGWINITQRSPCFVPGGPDCGKQAQDTTLILRVSNQMVHAHSLVNHPSPQSFGIASQPTAFGRIVNRVMTFQFDTLLHISRMVQIPPNYYWTQTDTWLFIPTWVFGKLNDNNEPEGHVLGMTVPYLWMNNTNPTGRPYQGLPTYAKLESPKSYEPTRLVGYRGLTPYPGLDTAYSPVGFYFVNGTMHGAKYRKGVFTAADVDLSSMTKSVDLKGALLFGPMEVGRLVPEYAGQKRVPLPLALVKSENETRLFLLLNSDLKGRIKD